MRKIVSFNRKISLLTLLLCMGVGCTNDTIVDSPYGDPLDFLNLFTASIEEMDAGGLSVIWTEEDQLGVFAGASDNKCFVVKENMNSSAVFQPEDELSIDGPIARIHAYYPYSTSAALSEGQLMLSLPTLQPYSDGGPSIGIVPLVGTGTTRSILFKQVCGAIKLRLADVEFGSVRKVTVTALDQQPLAGKIIVDFNYDVDGAPSTSMSQASEESIVVDCGDEGVEITSKGKDFYFVVPPATYGPLVFFIENTDGETFENRTQEPLVVKPGQIADAGLARVYIEEPFYGKANCIQHDIPGTYTFDVSPYFTTDSYGYAYEFNTNNELVLATSADLLWQSAESMITDIALSEDRKSLTFTAAKTGNALVAIYDAQGEILWSFHLWIAPMESVLYPNGYYVLDRNLGAMNNIPGDHGCWGLYYQWGRKDPLPELEKNTEKKQMFAVTYFDKNNQPFELEGEPSQEGVDQYWATKHPTSFIARAGSTLDWVWECGNNRLWGNPEGYNHPDIATLNKSIYDPCPEGYMVAPVDIWSANGVENGSFANNPYDKTNEGRTLTLNGINQWYPGASYYHNNYPTNKVNLNIVGRTWTSAPVQADASKAYGIVWGNTEKATYPEWSCPRAYGFNVRCVKVVKGQ